MCMIVHILVTFWGSLTVTCVHQFQLYVGKSWTLASHEDTLRIISFACGKFLNDGSEMNKVWCKITQGMHHVSFASMCAIRRKWVISLLLCLKVVFILLSLKACSKNMIYSLKEISFTIFWYLFVIYVYLICMSTSVYHCIQY